MPVEKFLDERDGEKPLGVYALYDNKNNIQYVSFSRNVVLSVRVSHGATAGCSNGWDASVSHAAWRRFLHAL
jgi:hypothetical protein